MLKKKNEFGTTLGRVPEQIGEWRDGGARREGPNNENGRGADFSCRVHASPAGPRAPFESSAEKHPKKCPPLLVCCVLRVTLLLLNSQERTYNTARAPPRFSVFTSSINIDSGPTQGP